MSLKASCHIFNYFFCKKNNKFKGILINNFLINYFENSSLNKCFGQNEQTWEIYIQAGF